MTSVFFVRHAQPDSSWEDDRTRPLTELGLKDSLQVTETLKDSGIQIFYCSPYKRSYDTILDCAKYYNMPIHIDERLRERKVGIDSGKHLERRWEDFSHCEESGENLISVQQRNMEALTEILARHPGQKIAIGTHGAALSTILNHYDPSFHCDDFKRILISLPYIIRLDFDGTRLIESEELLKLDRGY